MPLNRNNKIHDAWQVPAGRDMLLLLMRQLSMSEEWPEKPLVARRSIASLEKLAGPEYVDMLLDAVNTNEHEPVPPLAAAEPKPAWWKQAVAYRVYLPSFMDSDHDGVGDLSGVIQRLPYLEKLGIDILWLSCLQTPMPGARPVEITEIQPDYGTLEDFDTLVDAAENRAMRVVLELDAVGNAAQLARGMRFWKAHGVYGFCLVNLNLLGKPPVENLPGPPLRRLLCGPAVRGRMRELADDMRDDGEIFLAGEVPLASAVAAKLFCTQRGGGLDLLVETGHLMRPGPTDGPQLDLSELKSRYLRFYGNEDDGCWMPLTLQTADIPRLVSRVGASGVYRTVLAKMLATLTLTLRGTPILYQGEELGLGNTQFTAASELRDERTMLTYEEMRGRMGEKPALEFAQARAADHARLPFPWSATAGGGFSGAVPWMRTADGLEHLNANVQMGDKSSVWQHYAQLIDLRHDNPAFVYGGVKPVFQRNRRVFCYFRVLDNEKWYVEINLTGKETPRPGRILRSMKLALSNYTTGARTLRPYEANVYRCE